jgi:6-phosphogluconolactonase
MKKLLLAIALLSPVFTYAQNKNGAPSTFDVLIGTYTNGTSTSKGIYVYRFYERNGKLAYLSEIDNVSNPSYLTVSNNNKFIYAVNEGPQGAVSSFTFNPATGKMVFINKQETQGADPCYVVTDKDQHNLFVANYSSGSLAVLPISKDGSIGAISQHIQDAGTGVNKERQEGPHVHMAALSPNEKYLLYTDLGTDKLNVMRYKASKTPPLTPADQPFVKVDAGNGPRHLTFSADGKYVYLVQEIGGFINGYNYDNGSLKQVQSVDMKTPEMNGNVGSAAIHLSPDGRFLYASNRGNGNDIVQYSINTDNGQLTFVSRTPSLGKGPRDFIIDPAGKYLLIANQVGNNIVVYRLDPATGKPAGVIYEMQLGSPVCLKIVPAE